MRRFSALGPRRFWLLALVSLGLGLFAIVAMSRSKHDRLPDPNGFDDLIQATSLIQGQMPNQGNWETADLNEIRAFVQQNRPALERARLGISRGGITHFADSLAGLDDHLKQAGAVRTLTRLLAAQARVAVADGRPGDAARINVEILQVGQMFCQGAAILGATVGWVVQDQGIARLRVLGDSIADPERRVLLSTLEELDARRVSLAIVEDREERLFAGVTPLWVRVQFSLTGTRAVELVPVRRSTQQVHDRVERNWRFLMVEWAIKHYHMTTGKWPRSVAELVPGYLRAVPIDPTTNQALIYPSNDAGELTDDLSKIGSTVIESTPP